MRKFSPRAHDTLNTALLSRCYITNLLRTFSKRSQMIELYTVKSSLNVYKRFALRNVIAERSLSVCKQMCSKSSLSVC